MYLRALTRAVLALALPLAAPTAASGAAGPWLENAEARVRLVGDDVGLGLEFELKPGWHIYWKNSGDAGYPPRLDLSATPEIGDSRLLFPPPRRFDLGAGMVSFGYEGHVLYPIEAKIPQRKSGAMAVRARVDYLVCREECIPNRADLALDLPARSLDSGPEISRLATARAALPRLAGSSPGEPRVSLVVRAEPAGAWILEATAAGGDWKVAAPDIFFEEHPLFALARPELRASKSGLRFRIPIERRDLTLAIPLSTDFSWTLVGFERATPGAAPRPLALAGTTRVELPH